MKEFLKNLWKSPEFKGVLYALSIIQAYYLFTKYSNRKCKKIIPKQEPLEEINSQNFPLIIKQYGERFNKSGIIESIIPRNFASENDLLKFTTNLQYTKNQNDLNGLTKAVSEPIWDLLDRGGKRWRPILCIFIAESFGYELEDIQEIAGLCEIVHNGTLIVDDIEDNSETRRNKPCVHKIFGVDISINAGNMMYFAPFLYLLNSKKYTNEQKLRFSKIFAEEMTALHLGQGWDIVWHNSERRKDRIPSEKEYLQMTAHKTGVLARLSSRLVCAALGLNEALEKSISTFSERIGVAFQIQDDILNLEGEDYQNTKGFLGEDIHEGKMSLMVIHSLHNSQENDKQRLLQILQLKTNEQRLIQEAIALIRKSKSFEYAKTIAEDLILTAWRDDLSKSIPESNGKKKLQFLAEFTIGRKI